MRKTVLIISALITLSACEGKRTQTENADTAATSTTEMMAQQSCSLTGAIGGDKAGIVLERDGNSVMGVVTRCDFCEPFNVEGTWEGGNIKVEGFSMAGSHIKYELTVTGNSVQGKETLSAEGEVEEQNVTMTIE